MTSVFVPLALLNWFFAESILLASGQNSEVARLTARQLRALLPAIYIFCTFDLVKRWLACLRENQIPMYAITISFALHQPICLILLFYFELGVIGLAIGLTITNFITLAIVFTFIWKTPRIRQCLQPFSMEVFKGWGAYLRVAVPSMVMLCAEWWALDVLTLLAGILGVKALASMTIVLQVNGVLYMIAKGG